MKLLLLGEEILKLSPEKEAKIDSTPLEASRSDKHPIIIHIMNVKWIKHILQWLEYILFYDSTKGVARDSPELINHIEALKKMNANIEFNSANGGYDSFLNHSDIWYHLNAKPLSPRFRRCD